MSTEPTEIVSIISMADGEAIQQLDDAIADVWENIADVNTEATAKREITLKMTFVPDHDREVVLVGLKVEKKLAGRPGATGKILLGIQGGRVVASEIKSRQTTIEDHVANVLSINTRDKNGKEN